jgi:moderate conductance mechanosensitive channel
VTVTALVATPPPALPGLLPAQPTCADDPGSWCAVIYQLTNNDFISRSADTIITTSFQVALIIALSFLARAVLHRTIHRLVEGAVSTRMPRLAGRVPRLRRRGSGSPAAQASTGTAAPATPRRSQRARTIGSVLRSLSSVVVLAIGSIMVLAEFGVALGPILASAGIVGVAVGFGAQNLVRDFLSGMFMLLEDQYGVGDIVDVGEASGVVEAVGLRITTLRDGNGTVWYVRNGEILRVGNKSQGFAVAVVDLPVAHTADLSEATRIAGQVTAERVAAEDLAAHVLEPPEVLGVEKVGPEGVTLRLTVKVNAGQQWVVQRALHAAIADAFDDAGIARPMLFPGAPGMAAPSAP